MKHLFIVNPVAGKQKPETKMKLISDAIASLDISFKENNSFEVYVTKAPMDACDKIRNEVASGQELRVYACGGDGTLNECVNGVVGCANASVTHFPCGTGNDFIKMFGEERSRFFDLKELITGVVKPLDVIKCNDRYSINICSLGLDARVGADVHKYSNIPLIGGAGGYIISLAVNYAKGLYSNMTAQIDGLTCGPELNVVCVCNGRYYGDGFNPTNEARPDDGMMDILIVSGVNRLSFLKVILGYAAGKYKKFPQYITYLRTKHLEVKAERNEVINIDGESEHSNNVIFDIIPDGVNFIVPVGMDFFK